ncbi:MAG: hypothetical protein DRN81_05210 [Thermoproteota archaeon]|nr:MAG: hypothetical protein DRN81_05210 [Candidatus Korarchaeota archaeon]
MSFNYERLMFLTKDVPHGLMASNKKKEEVNNETRARILKKWDYRCYLCNREKHCIIHHRIPNGDASDENLYPLCEHCHKLVHTILWLDGKWMFQGYRR